MTNRDLVKALEKLDGEEFRGALIRVIGRYGIEFSIPNVLYQALEEASKKEVRINIFLQGLWYDVCVEESSGEPKQLIGRFLNCRPHRLSESFAIYCPQLKGNFSLSQDGSHFKSNGVYKLEVENYAWTPEPTSRSK